MKILELTAQQIIDLYKKHGLRPSANTARVKNGCTCAIGVLAVDNGTPFEGQAAYKDHLPPCDDTTDTFDLTLFGLGFDTGFDTGFEGTPLTSSSSRFYAKGHEIGAEIRKAFFRGEL